MADPQDQQDSQVPLGSSLGSSGNRARDHLANERTYLAWLRTAIGVLALAAAIARFGTSVGARQNFAVFATAALGIFLLGVGTRRYYQVSADLEAGQFQISKRTPMLIAAVVLFASVVVLALLL
jgi:putative membrane protein